MASTEMARNARAFTAMATLAAGVLFGIAVWRAARPHAGGAGMAGATIMGRVVGEDGRGIEGLAVVIADRGTVTGADGGFALAGLAPGRHGVLVAGSGYLPAVVDGVAAPAADVRVQVARAVVLAGRVSEGGAAAAGAEVVVSAGLEAGRAVTTDGSGAFRVEGLAEGRYTIVARRAESAALMDGVERFGAGPFADVELVLAPAAALTGRVLDESGAPVIGAHLVWVSSVADAAQRRVTSADGGGFVLDGLPPGDWSVDVQAAGYLPLTQRGVALQAGANPGLALTVQRGGAVSGRVTDRAGVGIAGAAVELVGADGRVVVSAVERARRAAWAAGASAAGGRLLPVGDLGVTVGPIPFPPAAGPRAAAAAPGPTASEDPSIAGLVTDADGSFHVDAVPPGKVVVRAGAAGWARGESAPLDVRAGVPASAAVTLVRGATVVIHVVDETGRDVRAALVRLGPGFAVSDAGGRARFEHVVAAGGAPVAVVDGPDRSHAEHAIAAPAELALLEETVVLATARPARVDPSAGGIVRMDLRDELTRGPILAFSAVARGPDGAVVHKSGTRGELTLGPLAPGSWTVRIDARGFATTDATFDIAAGAETPLRVELSQGGVVGGTVYGEHGDPVGGATVECGPLRATTSATGTFKLAGTPTGDVVVRASHPEAGRGEIVVPLHPGDEALTLEIRLQQ